MKYQIKLNGECGDETIIAEGNNKRVVKKEAREYLRYSDSELTKSQIDEIVNQI